MICLRKYFEFSKWFRVHCGTGLGPHGPKQTHVHSNGPMWVHKFNLYGPTWELFGSIFGISQIIIGLIVVAVGTSLPELAVTIGAIMKKRTDVVVGNVIGSNVLNIVLVVPIIGFFGSGKSLDPVLFQRDYFVMIFLTLFFALFVYLQTKKSIFKSIRLINFSGYLFVIIYILYILNLVEII